MAMMAAGSSPATGQPWAEVSPAHPRRSLPLRLFREHPGLALAVLVYLGLALSYFFIVPIFEGPDEWTHTGHVKYMAEGHGLPVMLPGQGIWGGQQPPLYYSLGALLMQPFGLDEFDDWEPAAKNPHASLGYALDPGNKNNYLHRPKENFPYHGLSLAVHVLRLYSMTFGLVALVFTYLMALEFFDGTQGQMSRRSDEHIATGPKDKTPLAPPASLFAAAVALFVACQPMFAFITALVANEPANIAFCAVGLWLAQRYVLYGPSRHWGRAAALGVTLGLISLSKMTGLSLGLVAVVAMLITAVSTRQQPGAARRLWRDGLIIALLFLVVGGWWYWRNYRLYGDFFQQGLYKIYFNVDPQPLTLDQFLYTLSTGEVSFWAAFGWLNTVAPDWVYAVYRVISRVGLLGVGLAALGGLGRRGIEKWTGRRFETGKASRSPGWLRPLTLHLVFPAALAFSLTRLVAIEGGLQGRQLLPALGSLALVVVAGWWALAPGRLRQPVLAGLLAVLLGLAAWLPYGVVAPAYIPAPLLAETDLPADLHRLDLVYRDEMKLLGVKIGADQVQPGQRVPVTAYWQALRPMKTNYSVFVHLIGRGYQTVGQTNTYPGLGLRPTTALQPGQIVADTYPVLVDGGSLAPARLLVNIGLFDFKEPGRPGIPPLAGDGRPAGPTVGQLKLVPAKWPPAPPPPSLAEFGPAITLGQATVNGCQAPVKSCQVTFTWLAHHRPAADYTVFIQLWPTTSPAANGPAAGFDGPPLAGDYPTGLWEGGEVIVDTHRLDLGAVPPGEYRLLVGLYNLTTGERLPATANGARLASDAVDLGQIQVEGAVSQK